MPIEKAFGSQSLSSAEELVVRNAIVWRKPKFLSAPLHIAILYVFAMRRHWIGDRAV